MKKNGTMVAGHINLVFAKSSPSLLSRKPKVGFTGRRRTPVRWRCQAQETFRSFKNYFPVNINHKSTANIGDGIGKELNPISFDRRGEEDLEVNSKKIFIWILVKF